MAERSGYDADFLGATVPLPEPTESGARSRLDYPHFAVLLDHDRRLARVTGVNVDGAGLVAVPRRGSWHLDPRVPDEFQAGAQVYARNNLDRGHLVRRRDPGWGPDAVAATEATFAYTNAAPQAAAFNQSPQLWLGLEDHVLGYAEAHSLRISVFTAPVLGDDDPPYRGIRIPRRFWKIIVWVSAEQQLAASAFLLDQSDLIADTGEQIAATPLPPFRTFQLPVRDVTTLAGIDAGPLVAADVLRTDPLRVTRWISLRTPDDIVLSRPGRRLG